MKYFFCLIFITCSHLAQAAMWTYNLPSTEKGAQYYKMVELYYSRNDLKNISVAAKQGRAVEPDCFYFADRYAYGEYGEKNAAGVKALSDSLIRSQFATSKTYTTNAWIHEWLRDFQIATATFTEAVRKFPKDLTLLDNASSYFQDRKDWDNFLKTDYMILNISPFNETAHYDLFLYYDRLNVFDKALMHGESTIFIAPFSPDNLTIKNKLFELYNKIVNHHNQVKNQKLEFFSDMLGGASENIQSITKISDIIYVQSVILYNYSTVEKTDFPEKQLWNNLFKYKHKIMSNGYWDTCWYWMFGNAKFPVEYKEFIDKNADVLAGFMQWLNANKLNSVNQP